MSDFSMRRTKPEFVAWIHAWMQGKALLQNIRSAYVRNRQDKRMYEEALPAYNYIRRWHGDDISVELPGDSGSADGIIYESRGKPIEYLQITLPLEKDDHLTRSQLAGMGLPLEQHFSSGESLASYAGTASDRIEHKFTYAYEEGTVLLVPLSAGMILEEESRFEAVERAMRPIPATHRFRRIVLMDYLGKFMKDITGSRTK